MTDNPAPAGVPTCYRHPGRESHIRCQRCGRPICPDCMRNASVGFQCPECVAQGRSETRQPRSFAGVRGGFRGAPVTWTLIASTVVVYVIVNVSHSQGLLYDLMLHPRGFCLMGN